jgi:hypothetical protein
MAKARMVYASMSTDEQIASLSFKAQFLWPWLLPHCSDQGRILASALKIKLVVVPGVAEITSSDIEAILKEYADKGLIILYEAEEHRILQVKNWWRYQKLSWAYPDELPPPDGWQDRLRYWHGKRIVTENWPTSAEGQPTPESAEAQGSVQAETILPETIEQPGECLEPAEAQDSGQPGADEAQDSSYLEPTYPLGSDRVDAKTKTKTKTNTKTKRDIYAWPPSAAPKSKKATGAGLPKPPDAATAAALKLLADTDAAIAPYRVAFLEGWGLDTANITPTKLVELAPTLMEFMQLPSHPSPKDLAACASWKRARCEADGKGPGSPGAALKWVVGDYAAWVRDKRPGPESVQARAQSSQPGRPARPVAMDRRAGDAKHYNEEMLAAERAKLPSLEVEWAGRRK